LAIDELDIKNKHWCNDSDMRNPTYSEKTLSRWHRLPQTLRQFSWCRIKAWVSKAICFTAAVRIWK